MRTSVAELRCLQAAPLDEVVELGCKCASAPPLTTTDAETDAYGDPLADWWQVSLPASMGTARGGQSGPIYSGMPRVPEVQCSAEPITAPPSRVSPTSLQLPPE